MPLLLAIFNIALAADTDLDGVDNKLDKCPYEDDTIDLDNDNRADCRDTMFNEFGFATAASSAANYMDAYGVISTWSSADFNGYVYSGVGKVVGYSDLSLYYAHCVPLTGAATYTVMGQMGTDDFYGSDHELVVVEYSDTFCGRKSTSRIVDSGSRPSGTPFIDLVGTYTPSGFAIRSVMVYATFANVSGTTDDATFDNLSMHAN
ncbi:MAG: hypothetical protein Q8P41_17365 [Pseudomonadota bacterium]|nr:hypothetical protein [Pseudomonadota bacterium]